MHKLMLVVVKSLRFIYKFKLSKVQLRFLFYLLRMLPYFWGIKTCACNTIITDKITGIHFAYTDVYNGQLRLLFVSLIVQRHSRSFASDLTTTPSVTHDVTRDITHTNKLSSSVRRRDDDDDDDNDNNNNN